MGRSSIAGWGLFAGEKVRANQFLGVSSFSKSEMFLLTVFPRNIKEKSLGMKKVNEEDYYMIKKEYHSYLLSIKVSHTLNPTFLVATSPQSQPLTKVFQIKLSTQLEQQINFDL